MGICLQKPLVNFQTPKPSRTSSRQSFLYNSFTYDPTQTEQQSNFFFFDVPHYCQIQYILRKEQLKKQIVPIKKQKQQISSKSSFQLLANIEQHIEEIQSAIIRFKDINFSNKIKQIEKKSLISSVNNIPGQKSERVVHRLQQSKVLQQKQSSQLNKILNFQIASVNLNLNQYEVIENLCFDVYVKNTKVLTIQGNVLDNKWKPIGTNQISVTNVRLNFEKQVQQQNIYIKILSKLQEDEIIECTIPFNKITFKYAIPILQTCNIRTQQDKQPIGQLHFRVEYIQNFEEHRAKVINDLQVRKQALQNILQKAKQHKMTQLHDKTIVLEAADNQSYISETYKER